MNRNYNECFYLNNNSQKLIVAESVIDVLSIATMIREKENYHNYNYLALSGVSKKQSIFHHLEQQPEIDTLILSLDNDKTGEVANQKIKEQLQEMQWTGNIVDYISISKDWNEDLQKGIFFVSPIACHKKKFKRKLNISVVI